MNLEDENTLSEDTFLDWLRGTDTGTSKLSLDNDIKLSFDDNEPSRWGYYVYYTDYIAFCEEHQLKSDYDLWPKDMQMLLKLTHAE